MAKKPVKTITPVTQPADNKNVVYGLLLVLIIAFVYVCMNNKFIQDDAYISFRYIQNFVDGHGLVFNIGERVEGYTNLLWVLILSVFVFLKINVESISQILSVLFGVLVLFFTFRISSIIDLKDSTKVQKKSKGDEESKAINYFNLIPPVLLVFTGSFIFWSISGMETTMFLFFCLAGIYFYIKERNEITVNYRFTLFIMLATLTRPKDFTSSD